jgi:phage repressor protein C with HTH and peptisase S24 domain
MSGLNSTSFNPSKRLRSEDGTGRWPSTESIAKVLKAAEMTWADFIAILEQTAATPAQPVGKLIIALASLIYPPYRGLKHFDEHGNDVHGRVSYIVNISNDTMSPIYRDGDMIMVSTGMEVKPNHRVLLYPKAGGVLIGKVIAKTEETINLESFQNSSELITIPQDEIAFIHKIDWLKQ